jgi:hypothetical protein
MVDFHWSAANLPEAKRLHFDVICEGQMVGRIFQGGHSAPSEKPWFWGFAYGYHQDRTPTHGYEPTCEVAMAAFRRS